MPRKKADVVKKKPEAIEGTVFRGVRGDAAHAECATFETAAEFTEAANRYFDECDASGTLYGEAGLCLALTKYNRKGRTVNLRSLKDWYDGYKATYLQDAVQQAYLRIQSQIETDPRYQEKGGMATRAIFLQKQKRLGGYQDKPVDVAPPTINITFGKNMDESDFK